MSNDPVFQASQQFADLIATDPTEPQVEVGKWYHWTETWADFIGPYDTEQEARQKCKEYADSL